jgi:hypothetical protein
MWREIVACANPPRSRWPRSPRIHRSPPTLVSMRTISPSGEPVGRQRSERQASRTARQSARLILRSLPARARDDRRPRDRRFPHPPRRAPPPRSAHGSTAGPYCAGKASSISLPAAWHRGAIEVDGLRTSGDMRDRLLIAVLISCPMRLKNLMHLVIGQHLVFAGCVPAEAQCGGDPNRPAICHRRPARADPAYRCLSVGYRPSLQLIAWAQAPASGVDLGELRPNQIPRREDRDRGWRAGKGGSCAR